MIYLAVFLLLILFGESILSIIRFKGDVLEKVALGFLLGDGVFTFTIFLLGYFGFKLSVQNIMWIVSLVVIIDILFITTHVNRNLLFHLRSTLYWRNIVGGFKNYSKIKQIGLLLILFLILASLFQNIYWPPRYWDAITLYDGRARILFGSQDIRSLYASSYYLTYPLLTSLSHYWVYLFGGNNPSFLYSNFYASIIIIFYYCIKRIVNKEVALISVLFIAANAEIFSHSLIGYSNLPYTVYLVSGIFYLYLYWFRREKSYYLVSALLVSMSFWVRSTEPFWVLCVLCAFVIGILVKKYFYIILYLLPIYIIRYSWYKFISSASSTVPIESGLVGWVTGLFQKANIGNITNALVYSWNNSLSLHITLLVPFLITLPFLYKKKMFVNFVFSTFFIGGVFIMIFFGSIVYSVLGNFNDFLQLSESLRRVSMLFVPLLVFFTTLNFSQILSSDFINKHHK